MFKEANTCIIITKQKLGVKYADMLREEIFCLLTFSLVEYLRLMSQSAGVFVPADQSKQVTQGR